MPKAQLQTTVASGEKMCPPLLIATHLDVYNGFGQGYLCFNSMS